MPATVRIITLGGFRLESGTRALLHAGKPLACLLVLSRAPDRRMPRSELVRLLWGDSPGGRARQSLRQALVTLREVLGSDAVATSGDEVLLTAPVRSDLDDLREMLSDGDLVAALARKPGAFVAAYEAPGGAGFESWCEGERKGLSQQLSTALAVFATPERQVTELAMLQDIARGVLRIDPANDVALRILDKDTRASVAQPGLSAPGAPLEPKVPGRSPAPRILLAAGISTSIILVSAAIAAVGPSRAAGLALVVSPIAIPGDGPFLPAPVIEVVDAQGRRVATEVPITARLVTPRGNFMANATRPSIDGRALFSDLEMDRSTRGAPYDSLRLVFESPGLAPVTFALPHDLWGDPLRHNLRQRAIRLDGAVTDRSRPLAVRQGQAFSVDLDLVYSSPWPAASVIMGAWATWMPRQEPITVRPLVTPALDRPEAVRLQLKAPGKAGLYHLIVAFNAEDRVVNFFSGTNWILGEPRWHDGNDIADWSETDLEDARRLGGAWMRYYHQDWLPSRDWIAATVVDIAVH